MKEVYAIFDDAQKSASTRTSCARKLKAVVEKKANNRELFEILFCHCFDRVLLCSKTDAKVERISAFFAEGVSSFTESNLELALEFLLERSLAVDKTVRFRACQTIANILSLKSSDQCEISEAICDKIVESLIIRMNDRFANVRVQAIIALKNLQRPVEADTVTSEFLRLMNSDPSNEVRAIATECILINAYTLPSLVARVRDVHKTVRISALNKLAQHVDMRHLTVQMRGMIVRHGLSDRDVTVKQAAVDLVFAWLRTFDYKVPQMLKYLGLAQNEEEIESVVFEIMASIDKRDDITSDIKKKIIGQAINWTGRLDTISPAEFVWTQLRCLYAFRRLPSTQATNAISELIPDIVEVCRILKSVPVTVLSANVNLQMSVRNLLKMGIYFDKSDTIGNKDLSDTCRTLVLNIDIPDSLIEPLMNAWKNSMENLGEYTFQLYHELVVDAQKNIPEFTEIAKESSGPSSPRTPSFRTSTDTPRTDESLLDERYHVESRVIIRTLQIIAYSLQQVIGTVTPSVLELETYESYLPFLFESLQRPDPELRSLSITCLGLLPLFSENFAGHHDILLQAASAELEDDSIRGQALQSLVDIASINEDKFKNDITLSNLLSRILNHSSGSLQRLAVEGTAKLLFSGCLTDPRLFANLMKFFFLPQLSSDLGAGSADPNESYEYLNQEESDINALLGTQARLHQALSLFFHFFLVEGQGRENTFVDSVSELCSDVAQLMRDDVIDASSLSTVCINA